MAAFDTIVAGPWHAAWCDKSASPSGSAYVVVIVRTRVPTAVGTYTYGRSTAVVTSPG